MLSCIYCSSVFRSLCFCGLIMAPKRSSNSPAASAAKKKKNEPKRSKKVMTLHEKVELLDMIQEGHSIASVGRHYGINESTVRYIKKKEAEIRKNVSLCFRKDAKTVSQVRDKCIVRMEAALAIWVGDCRKKDIPLDGLVIREKARSLYKQYSGEEGIVDETEEGEQEEQEGEPQASSSSSSSSFMASKGWFYRFTQRYGIKNVILYGEKASADNI